MGGRSEVKPKELRDPLFRLVLAEKLARSDDASNGARPPDQGRQVKTGDKPEDIWPPGKVPEGPGVGNPGFKSSERKEEWQLLV